MSRLPSSVSEQLQTRLGARVRGSRSVRGGDIHQAWQVQLTGGDTLFVKSSADTAPGLFAAEAAGLSWLAGHGAPTPEVLGWADRDGDRRGWLALRWHDPTGRGQGATLGTALARLHSQRVSEPGWTRPCFIGPLPQSNEPAAGASGISVAERWAEFWVERRLVPMTRMAGRQLSDGCRRLLDEVCDRCPSLLAEVPAMAPLHGDLWGGNVLWAEHGPLLIDPAVYAGDPDVDLAMMALFGGFDSDVWGAYHNILPRRPGFEARQALYQLWPLLVHVVLFGGGYAAGVERNARAALS